MTDKHELQHLPGQSDTSIAFSTARSGLVARGRRDASSLMARKPEIKLPNVSSWKKLNYMGIAMKHYRGEGVPQDYGKAAYFFRILADLGHADAQYYLGSLYAQGRGVPKDNAEAAIWFRKAADQGHARAQCEVGWRYNLGRGLPRDYAQAAIWYRKAADQGNVYAQDYLGSLYYEGAGVVKDYAQAATWYRKAADQGAADAQYNLALQYAKGQGLPQDYAEAYFWLYLAATRDEGTNKEKAATARDAAAVTLTPAQQSEVQERAARWFAEHPQK